MAPTVLSGLEVESSSRQPSRLLEAEKTTPPSLDTWHSRGVYFLSEKPTQSLPTTDGTDSLLQTKQGAQDGCSTRQQRAHQSGSRFSIAEREAWEPELVTLPMPTQTGCPHLHRSIAPLPGSHAARGTPQPQAPRPDKSLPPPPPQTHEVPEQLCSAETRGGFFHLPASFSNQLVP